MRTHTGYKLQRVKAIRDMRYFIKNGTLFVSDTDNDIKEDLIGYVIKNANSCTDLESVPGALSKTLYQAEEGFFFENEGPFSFAVVGFERNKEEQSHVILSNDDGYLQRLLEDS